MVLIDLRAQDAANSPPPPPTKNGPTPKVISAAMQRLITE